MKPKIRNRRPIQRRNHRRGITSAMAMLYLTLFATLSLGFYASVTTSVQVAKNDQRNAKALLAAESGVQFMRYHLANVDLSPTSLDPMGDHCTDLKARLEGTSNLGSNHVTLSNNTITIPAETGSYIKSNSTDNSGFSAVITDHGGNIVCTITGRTGLLATSVATKGVSLDFRRAPALVPGVTIGSGPTGRYDPRRDWRADRQLPRRAQAG